MPQQYYPQQQPEPTELDYEEPMEHDYRRHGRHNIYERPSISRMERDDDEYETDADYEDCKCSCSRCRTHPHKPCCREVCQTCEDMRQPQQDLTGNPSLQQGSVLFVPYPYPLMVPNNNVKNDVKTTTASTTTTTTTTEDPDKLPRELKKNDRERKKSSAETNLYKNQIMKNERYMLTTVRKTKPAWEPKYGIVPIPDTLAEKLMNQLKQNHGRVM